MFNIENLPITKFIVIGSYGINSRLSKDIDVICSIKDLQITDYVDLDHTVSFTYNNKKIECFIIEKQESFKILYNSYFNNNPLTRIVYANNYELFAIKKAHIHRANLQWEKHISDYHVLKNRFEKESETKYTCCNQTYTTEQFFEIHKQTLDTILKKQRQVPLKNINKEQFFDDYVKKHFEHDWLHTVYQHKHVPIYTLLQNDPNIVYCDPLKWEALTETERLYCVLEECYVIATERFLIKNILEATSIPDGLAFEAFKKALIKVCTTLTSGFFREFAIENYFILLNNFNIKFYEILLNRLKITA